MKKYVSGGSEVCKDLILAGDLRVQSFSIHALFSFRYLVQLTIYYINAEVHVCNKKKSDLEKQKISYCTQSILKHSSGYKRKSQIREPSEHWNHTDIITVLTVIVSPYYSFDLMLLTWSTKISWGRNRKSGCLTCVWVGGPSLLTHRPDKEWGRK